MTRSVDQCLALRRLGAEDDDYLFLQYNISCNIIYTGDGAYPLPPDPRRTKMYEDLCDRPLVRHELIALRRRHSCLLEPAVAR
jgi:hypothetical protein